VTRTLFREIGQRSRECGLQFLAGCCFTLLFGSFAAGCAGPSSLVLQPSSAQQPSVNISPQSLEIKRGGSWEFSAGVANANDTSVTWSIQEGSVGGVITDAGLYTAPVVDGLYHVIATSRSDMRKSATASISVMPGVFTPTDNLGTGRFLHTSTLLPNGRVFVAGGLSSINPDPTLAAQSEQFDPATGTFRPDGTISRAYHTATVLSNGDVLIAGGAIDWITRVSTDSAFLLKAGSGILQQTGNMISARYGHTATLLQNGKVLITGGATPSVTATAELYDPVSGTFAPAGNMTVPRTFHTATLLVSSKVLVTGWWGSAELYDPATNSFTATGSMAGSRFDCTATLLPNGKVLVAGGEAYYDVIYEGPAEIYDPGTGQFTPAGSMLTPRWSHTATLLPNGTVLLAGGTTDAGNVRVAWTEIFHPDTSSFTQGSTMSHGRVLHTATLLSDGSVLVMGGLGTQGLSSDNSAEIYK
jgi:Galactose oxidase, central domain/Bacterial Ig-like domain (group 2)